MSLRLILMRHAKSSWDNPDWSDKERPLNQRGRRSAVALGKWLAKKGYLPDLVLCSTAQRTRETLDGLRLGAVPVKYLDALYHASTNVLLETLQEEAVGKSVLIITHNPGCANFADRILSDRHDHEQFHDYPTGATLVADLPAQSWSEVEFHRGDVVDFVVPRDLLD